VKRRWTELELDFLIKNYKEYGSKYCAFKLGVGRRRVRIRASRLGLKYLPNNKICSGCFQTKPLSEFSPAKQCKFGVQSKCKRCRADWESNRKKTDKNYRILHSMRNRIRMAIKNNVKRGRSLELIGCSIDFLKDYLTKKFAKGMSWENHGKWHIDHIRPCSSFDLSKKEEQEKCFHYTNLQPLWSKDNLSKGDRLV
jgi:hypothetical protein